MGTNRLRLNTISRVGAYEVLGVNFTRNDANVRVPPGAFVSMRALAQRICIDLLDVGSLLSCEKSAWLLALAAQSLNDDSIDTTVIGLRHAPNWLVVVAANLRSEENRRTNTGSRRLAPTDTLAF